MRELSLNQLISILDRGLETARRQGATSTKILFSQSENFQCLFENGKLKDLSSNHHSIYFIDVIVDRKKGSAAGTDLRYLEELISRAITLTHQGSPVHFDSYPPPAPLVPVKTYSPKTAELNQDQLIQSCQQIIDRLQSYDPALYIQADGNRSISEEILITSGGVCHHSYHSLWSIGAYSQKTRDTDMLFSSYGRSWRELNEFFDPTYIAERIIEDLKNGEKIVPAPTGKTMAFLPPEVFRLFLTPLVIGINGRNIFKGDSPLRGRLGEKILHDSLTIIDDPHRDYDPGAAEIDSDGTPTQVIPIMEKGILKNFLYDLDTAGMAGAKTTGNSGCSPYSLDIHGGNCSSQELFNQIKDGIYIRHLIGFGQSNLTNGEISGNIALGFRIRNGQIIGRVKNTMMAGNIYELFKNHLLLSSDRDPLLRTPAALIEGLTLSSANQ